MEGTGNRYAVTFALTAFARAVPYWIASSDKSEPSVGMRMWVCIIEIPRKNASTVQVRSLWQSYIRRYAHKSQAHCITSAIARNSQLSHLM